jgi:hypothetical protein
MPQTILIKINQKIDRKKIAISFNKINKVMFIIVLRMKSFELNYNYLHKYFQYKLNIEKCKHNKKQRS